MVKLNLKNHSVFLYATLAIIVAIVLRQIGFLVEGPLEWFCSILRSSIYIGMFSIWGVSIRRRIIQPQVRRYLTAISALMVFWVTVRTIRFLFAQDPRALRLLWYMYYLPMLFIPCLAVFVALSLGKPESFCLPKWTALLYIPTAAFLLLVLTNDFHQLVFAFPADAPVWVNDYRYAMGYFLVVGWQMLCALTALVAMLIKCRLPNSRKVLMLPFVPVILALIYGVLYIFRVPCLKSIAGDMTVVFCLLFASVLEICIQCRLIQSNTRYVELFRSSTIAAQITDQDLNVRYAAENVKLVEKPLLESAKREAVILDGGIRLCAAPIRGGYVYWQEDISALLALLYELSGTKEELKSYGSLLEEENKQKKRQMKLEEQKRLFNTVQKTVKPRLELLTTVSRELQTAPDTDTAKKALGKIAVIGAYLKRRSNLILLADRLGQIPSEELHLCLKETASNLRLYGVTCAVRFDLEGSICPTTAGMLFDFFEAAMELSLDTLTDMTAFVVCERTNLRCTLMLQCDADMTRLSEQFYSASVMQEDGVWYCTLTLKREVRFIETVSKS